MNVTVLANPQSANWDRIQEAVRDANRLQSYFRFDLRRAPWIATDRLDQARKGRVVRDKVLKRHGIRCVAVVDFTLDGDLMVDEYRGVSIVSNNGWDDEYQLTALKYHLLQQFSCAALNFVADLTDEQIADWAHKKADGCIFDWYEDRSELRRTMTAGVICEKHQGRLAQMGVDRRAVEAAEVMIQAVREAVIGRVRPLGTTIFVGHGHDQDWKVVQSWLVKLGLEVEEFNVVPTVGFTNVQRLQAMLEKAAAAVILLTGEIPYPDGRLHARENVIHEIGLLQGKLGFDRVAILVAEGTEKFSNIDGVTVAPFRLGRFRESQDAQEALRGFLARLRLLEVPQARAGPSAR